MGLASRSQGYVAKPPQLPYAEGWLRRLTGQAPRSLTANQHRWCCTGLGPHAHGEVPCAAGGDLGRAEPCLALGPTQARGPAVRCCCPCKQGAQRAYHPSDPSVVMYGGMGAPKGSSEISVYISSD